MPGSSPGSDSFFRTRGSPPLSTKATAARAFRGSFHTSGLASGQLLGDLRQQRSLRKMGVGAAARDLVLQGLQRADEIGGLARRLLAVRGRQGDGERQQRRGKAQRRAHGLRLAQQDFDAPVLRRLRIVGDPEAAVGMALDALEPLLVDAAAHQHVVGHVRARAGQPPVVVGAGLVGPAVGMPAHDQPLGLAGENLGELLHDHDHGRPRLGRGDGEHAEVVVVGEADQHALVGGLHVDVGQRARQRSVRRACLICASICGRRGAAAPPPPPPCAPPPPCPSTLGWRRASSRQGLPRRARRPRSAAVAPWQSAMARLRLGHRRLVGFDLSTCGRRLASAPRGCPPAACRPRPRGGRPARRDRGRPRRRAARQPRRAAGRLRPGRRAWRAPRRDRGTAPPRLCVGFDPSPLLSSCCRPWPVPAAAWGRRSLTRWRARPTPADAGPWPAAPCRSAACGLK